MFDALPACRNNDVVVVVVITGAGVVLAVTLTPSACTFTKSGAFRDTRCRVTLKPTAGGGAKRGDSVATRAPAAGMDNTQEIGLYCV